VQEVVLSAPLASPLKQATPRPVYVKIEHPVPIQQIAPVAQMLPITQMLPVARTTPPGLITPAPAQVSENVLQSGIKSVKKLLWGN
jgi:hypothetical protein